MKDKQKKPKKGKVKVISALAIHNEFYGTEQMLKELQPKQKDEKVQKPK